MFKYSFIIILAMILATLPSLSFAHCDTMDGPVVKDAQTALDHSEITPILKWIKPDVESDVRSAFEQTLAMRKQSQAAQQLADHYFFETLVRLHRAGENAPYTGVKPAGVQEPIIVAADHALKSGAADELVKQISTNVASELQHRYHRALTASKSAGNSVAEGREYVEAYVSFMHYIEKVYQGDGEHAAESAAPACGHDR